MWRHNGLESQDQRHQPHRRIDRYTPNYSALNPMRVHGTLRGFGTQSHRSHNPRPHPVPPGGQASAHTAPKPTNFVAKQPNKNNKGHYEKRIPKWKKEAAAAAANGATRSPLMPVSNLNQPAVISPSLDEMMADEMMADFVDYDAPMDTVDPRALLFADDDPVENQPSVTPFASMSTSSPTAPPTRKPSPTASPTPIPSPTASPTPTPSPTAPPAPKPPNPTPPTPKPPSTAPARTEAVLRTSGRRSKSKPDYDMRSHPLDPYLRTQSSAGGQPSDKFNSEGSSGLSDSEQSQSALVKPTRGLAHQVSEACHCCIQLS